MSSPRLLLPSAPLALLALLAIVAPTRAMAQVTTLMTEGGFVFDLGPDGQVESGSGGTTFVNPYSGCFSLTVNGLGYSGGSPTLSGDGRTVTYPEASSGSLRVQRIAYVPASGGDFVRYLDVVTNPTGAAATVSMSYLCQLGTCGEGSVRASSSGDTALSSADDWVTTNDSFSSYPALGFVMQGPGATTRTTSATFDGTCSFGLDHLDWAYSLSIPAGGHAAIVNFGIQKADTADAMTMSEAMRLDGVPDDVMVGLDSYLDAIVNFVEDVPGAPKIRFTGAVDVPEGDPVDVTLNVIDVGGPSTWSWDLNGDGTFGDMPGVTTYSVPAGTTDGPSSIRIGVEAVNGTATSRRYRTITVDNVAPAVHPPGPAIITTNGSDYHYQFLIDDPAGPLDPENFRCTTCPSAMTLSATGYMQWTPGDLDVTMPSMPTHLVVTIDDGDGGSTAYAWDLSVLPDHPPTRPTVIYPNSIAVDGTPRLIAGNSTDEDGDPLSYGFEIDTVTTFDSPAKQTSPLVPQTDGYTAWTPAALSMGTLYYWRVKANDTMVDSDFASASFYTSGTTPAPDMGVPDAGSGADGSVGHDAGGGTGERGGCCAVAGASGDGRAALFLLGGLGLAVARRRRR